MKLLPSRRISWMRALAASIRALHCSRLIEAESSGPSFCCAEAPLASHKRTKRTIGPIFIANDQNQRGRALGEHETSAGIRLIERVHVYSQGISSRLGLPASNLSSRGSIAPRPPSGSDPPLARRQILRGIEQPGNFLPQSNKFLILCRQILVSPTQFYFADRVRHTQLPNNLLKFSK
jgi:hypothetical protein